MSRAISLLVYPVKDLAAAKKLYAQLLGVEPYADQPYYVGFRVGDQEIGLDPHGTVGPIGYAYVDDIEKSFQELLAKGATKHQDVKNVGGGRLTALVKDADGNVLGLVQKS
jgi:predicted enzyme related to lactoylglutathione lyase